MTSRGESFLRSSEAAALTSSRRARVHRVRRTLPDPRKRFPVAGGAASIHAERISSTRREVSGHSQEKERHQEEEGGKDGKDEEGEEVGSLLPYSHARGDAVTPLLFVPSLHFDSPAAVCQNRRRPSRRSA